MLRVVELDDEVVDICFHRKAASAVCMFLCIVPFKVDAGNFFACPISGDFIVLL